MDQKIVDQLRVKLEAEKKLLTEELSGMAKVNPKNPKVWNAVPGETGEDAFRDEEADRIETLEEREAEIIPLEERLHNVEKALNKIATGTYGQCEVCQVPIEAARLEVNPAARTCKQHLDQESAR